MLVEQAKAHLHGHGAEADLLHERLGLELTAEAEGAMRHWLEARPREASRPAYSPEDYGLTAGQIRERFAAYDARFRPERDT